MTILSNNWADALEPLVTHWFEQGVNRRPSLLQTLYNVQGSLNSKEEASSIGAISVDDWDAYEEVKNVPQVDFDQGYKKTYTHVEKVVELVIEKKFVEDNKVKQITDAAMRLGDSASLKREYDRASVFNNAFDSNFVGGDAVALCSDSHPFGPQRTDSTQDNSFALALTKDSVKTVREAMMAYTDDKNQIVAVTPQILLVGPTLEDEAIVIAKTLLEPGTANNDINPMQGRFVVITDHYITDSNAWFLIDPMLMKSHLDWFDRINLALVFEGYYKQVSASWTARMRYSYGWSDWRWIAGSTTT